MPRLPSHRAVLGRLERGWATPAPSTPRPSAFVVLQLDHWHELHCSRGGPVQHQVWREAARRLQQAVASYQGEPADASAVASVHDAGFLVVLRGVGEEGELAKLVGALQAALRAPYATDQGAIQLTASAGTAVVTESHSCAADAFGDAMAALAVATERGPGASVRFDATLNEQLTHRFETLNALREALAAGTFQLHFQPIVALDSRTLLGLEALVRWPKPDGTLLLPDAFIGLAERSGLIVELDRWVLEAACRQLRGWQMRRKIAEGIPVSVNISGLHFGRADLLATIDRSLRSTGLYGRSLVVEITESAIMDNAPFTRDMLRQLRALGVRVSIDDFGTGYASLANLRQFDVDALKIDASFVARVDVDEESREIVRTIVSLAHGLGKRVIAEGIERPEQEQALRSLGCRLGQGFHFARPMEAEAVSRYFGSNSHEDLFTL